MQLSLSSLGGAAFTEFFAGLLQGGELLGPAFAHAGFVAAGPVWIDHQGANGGGEWGRGRMGTYDKLFASGEKIVVCPHYAIRLAAAERRSRSWLLVEVPSVQPRRPPSSPASLSNIDGRAALRAACPAAPSAGKEVQ